MTNANRSVSLAGANKIFAIVNAQFAKNEELGFYQCEYNGKIFQSRTLTECCQIVIKALREGK